jgi:hypothetical protein
VVTRDDSYNLGYGAIFDKTSKNFIRFATNTESGKASNILDNDPKVIKQLEYIKKTKSRNPQDIINSGNVASQKQATTTTYNKTEVLKGAWANFPCVVNHPKAKPEYVNRGGWNWEFKIGDFTYLSSGKKIGKDNVQTNYTCKDAEFKITRVVPKTENELSKGQGYLKYGDKNSLVSIIQDMLIFVGEKITKTGVYDRATYDAVKKFQTENKSITNQALKPDGLLGKNTYLSLKQKYDNLKRIEFKAPSIADTDTGDDVVVPDNNAASKTTTNQQTTSTDQARIDAAKNYVNYKDEYPETPPQ